MLTSSNASPKYIKNAFQTLCWPEGWVVHFRYELRWVEDPLRHRLPIREDTSADRNQLKGLYVLTAYVFQEREQSRPSDWNRVALYPMRYGKIVDAYKTGHGDYDVAHFYFKVERFWGATEAKSFKPEELLSLVNPGRHAGSTRRVSQHGTEGESAASALLDAIPGAHLTHQPDPGNPTERRQYYPILCYLRGLRPRDASRGHELKPIVGDTDSVSFYKLTEKHDYLFDFSFHVPATVANELGGPQSGSQVTLRYDKTAFASEAERTLAVESRYDEQLWLVAPASTERTILRELAFRTSLKLGSGQLDPLDFDFTIPVAIRQDTFVRLRHVGAGLIGDFGLALGTISLAVGKVAPTGGQPADGPFGLPSDAFFLAALGYFLSVVFKVIAGLWKP